MPCRLKELTSLSEHQTDEYLFYLRVLPSNKTCFLDLCSTLSHTQRNAFMNNVYCIRNTYIQTFPQYPNRWNILSIKSDFKKIPKKSKNSNNFFPNIFEVCDFFGIFHTKCLLFLAFAFIVYSRGQPDETFAAFNASQRVDQYQNSKN